MSILANPIQLQRGLRNVFIEALMANSPLLLPSIATYLSSDGDRENLAWLGDVQGVSEFLGEVQFDGLSEASFEAINKKYTGGIQVKRDDLADEKTGGIAIRIQDLARRAVQYWDEMLVDVLVNGATYESYDSNALFSATHPARGSSGVQSNLVSYSGSSTANAQTDIGASIAALSNMLDEAGKPCNRGFRSIYVLAPPALSKPISEAVTAGVVANTSNVQFSGMQVEIITEPLLTATSAAEYYVGIKDLPVRGLILQEREPVTFEALEDGDVAFSKEVYSYKVRMRGIAKPGRWQRVVKVA